jgi:hypothetical protein
MVTQFMKKLTVVFLEWFYPLKTATSIRMVSFCCSAGGIPSDVKSHSNISDFALQIYTKSDSISIQ